MNRVAPALLPSLAVAVALAIPRPAHALSCDEIMNMVNVNVPTNIVVQTMKDSGDQFNPEDVSCLQREGAPSEVVSTAKSMVARAEPEPPPVRDREPERRPSMEDDEDFSDRGNRGRSGQNDLTDEGSDNGAGDPQELKQAIKLLKSKKPLTATVMLYHLLEDGDFPEHTTKINYYLAKGLSDLEMYHGAQYHYMKVVKKGPNNPYFSYALPKLVQIARFTGDNTELMRIVAKIPVDAYPRGAKNQLYYLMGVRYYDKDELSRAAKYFGQVSSKSDLYLRSKYFEGVIFNQQGKLKSAVRSFRDVYRQEVEVYNDAKDLEEVERLKDLSLINIARIYYGIERFDESAKYYDLVAHDSTYWPQSLFEHSWANFMQNNLNQTLGQILTVQSPFYASDEFLPEATILRALTFFNLCQYEEVERLLLDFENTHRPMQDEMRDFVKEYASSEGKQLADQAWDTYFSGDRGANTNTTIPKAAFNRILRNQNLEGIVKHLEMMEAEERLIDDQKPAWRDSVGVYVKKIIEADRERYKRTAGRLFLAETARQANYISDLLTQSEIIRFEVVDAQRVDYQYKAQNIDLSGGLANREIDFATSVDYIYWPFNGEFWEDELGYYNYTEQSDCK